MPFEQRPNSAQLFRNRDRKTDKSPNLKGTGLLMLETGEIVELDIAGWTKESERAGKWLSLTIKIKGQDMRTDRGLADPPMGHQRFDARVQEIGTPLDGPAEEDDLSF